MAVWGSKHQPTIHRRSTVCGNSKATEGNQIYIPSYKCRTKKIPTIGRPMTTRPITIETSLAGFLEERAAKIAVPLEISRSQGWSSTLSRT